MAFLVGTVVKRGLNLRALLRVKRVSAEETHDAELDLYRNVLECDSLHAGYFRGSNRDPEAITLRDLKEAMGAYVQLILERVSAGELALDLGCGYGGVLGLLLQSGVRAVALTPNAKQAAHVRECYPGVPLLECRFEDIDVELWRGAFDCVICAESFHNVALEPGFSNVRALLKPGGHWLIADYYRLREDTHNRSGHLLQVFEQGFTRYGFRMDERLDITEEILPSFAYVHMLATRIGLPLLAFARLRFGARHPLVAYLLTEVLDASLAQLQPKALEPDTFRRDKRYLLHRLSNSRAT